MGRPPAHDRVAAAATWGLLAAWVVHDAEELATTPAWLRQARPRLEQRLPWVPPAVWDRAVAGPEHMALAVGLMGVLVAAAAADGARTGGRSGFYQLVLAGFGAHAVGHVGAAVVTRGYTPGVITAPTVVAPFAWWARRRLRAAGVPQAAVPPAALGLVPVAIGAAHLGATGLLRLRDRRARRR